MYLWVYEKAGILRGKTRDLRLLVLDSGTRLENI
jgi:hypothetical protein